MPDSQPDVSELAREVVDELEDTRQIGDQLLLSRREAIALSTGAVSLGARGVAGAGTASAQEAAGQIGTEAEPVDVEGAQGNFQALEAEFISNIGDEAVFAHPDEKSISDALTEAGEGGLVIALAGTYENNDLISQTDATLIGVGRVVIPSDSSLSLSSDGFSLQNIVVEQSHSETEGLETTGSSIRLVDCVFDATEGDVFEPLRIAGNRQMARGCSAIGGRLRANSDSSNCSIVGCETDDSVSISGSSENIETAGNVVF